MRVVVTGSSGHLGSTVVAALQDDGVEAIGLDAVAGPRTAVVADVRNAGSVREALRGATALIHAASLHAPHVPLRSKRTRLRAAPRRGGAARYSQRSVRGAARIRRMRTGTPATTAFAGTSLLTTV